MSGEKVDKLNTNVIEKSSTTRELEDFYETTKIHTDLKTLAKESPYTLVDKEFYEEITDSIDEKNTSEGKDRNFGDILEKTFKESGFIAAAILLFENFTKIFSGEKNTWNTLEAKKQDTDSIASLLANCDTMQEEITTLQTALSEHEHMMTRITNTASKITLCRRISRIKDALCARTLGKTNSSQTELFDHSIELGDVLIFNMKKKSNSLLQSIKTNAIITMIQQGTGGSVATHAAIVTSIDPLEITHSTGEKGVHTIGLGPYLQTMESGEFIALHPKQGVSEAVGFAKQAEGKEYDRSGGAKDTLAKERVSKDDAYYCSELVAEAYAVGSDINTPQELTQAFPMSYYHQFT